MTTSGARCFNVTTSSGRPLDASRLRKRAQSLDVLATASSTGPSPRTAGVTSASSTWPAATAPATASAVDGSGGRVDHVVVSDHAVPAGSAYADGPTFVASALLAPAFR